MRARRPGGGGRDGGRVEDESVRRHLGGVTVPRLAASGITSAVVRFFPGWLKLAVLVPVAVGALAAGAVAGAFALDSWSHRGEVVRNTQLRGDDVGGLGEADLRRRVELLAARLADTPVEVRAPGALLEGTAEEYGVTVDVDGTIAAALAAGRDGGPIERFRAWWGSFSDNHQVDVVYAYDPDAAEAAVTAASASIGAEPEEPWFGAEGGILEVREPVFGQRIDPAGVAAALPAAVATGHNPIQVDVAWTPIPTEVTQQELDAALAEAEALTAEDIWVSVDGRAFPIAAETQRRWLRAQHVEGKLVPVFDLDAAQRSVETFTAHLVSAGTTPAFAVVDGELTVQPGEPSRSCCADGVGELMWQAARGLIDQPVVLPLRLANPEGAVGEAATYGISEKISEFTTRHACCQSRVQNIHRIADILRGVIIAPGEQFSVNGFVGMRTREKGFVAAGAIEQGHLVSDVGGGVSQFATTIFNAAFFAGMDFIEYQSHTIYFSRYPFAREATISWPKPDLVFENNTPHHVMIWTSYTDTTITVEFWSTPYFVVEQTGQARFPIGACTGGETFRRRTTPDGLVLEDSVVATYRPAEGFDCNGRRIPEPRR